MTLVGGWLLVPAALAVLSCGIGLLVERVLSIRLPGGLVPALGLAGLVVIAGLLTIGGGTAPLASPACAALAVAGLALARPWSDERLRAPGAGWSLGAGIAGFAVLAMPSLLCGQGSVGGYIKLDDSPTWTLLAEHVLHHGRALSGTALSTPDVVLKDWLGNGYPVGAFLPFGVSAQLTGQNLANAYEPTLCTSIAIAALAFTSCAREAVRSAAGPAIAAAIAVQASLFVGYGAWGGIKEVTVVALLPLLAYSAVAFARPRRGHIVVLALACGALLGCLGIAGLVWVGPALALGALTLALALRSPRALLARACASAPLLALAALPALLTAHRFEQVGSAGDVTSSAGLGNLIAPLKLLQGAGLWPEGDFRFHPHPYGLAVLLAVGGIGAATAAVVLAIQRKRLLLPALVGIVVVGAVPALIIGGPWVDAKTLAITSACVLLGSATLIVGGVVESRGGLQIAAAVAGAAVVAACVWSTTAIWREIEVAPRERLQELANIDRLLDGRGPTLLLNFETWGRPLLTDADYEGASDRRARPVTLSDGTQPAALSSVDADALAPPTVATYRDLITRRSPVASRPPGDFRRIWAGSSYLVWERSAAPHPLAHVALGDAASPAARPRCADVLRLAHMPRIAGLRYAAAPDVVTASIAPVVRVAIPHAGRWRVWVEGSTRSTLEVFADGRSVGTRRHELSYPGNWLRYGQARLGRGLHFVSLIVRSGWRPGRGSAATQATLGPRIALTAGDDPPAVATIAPSAARTLCDGRSFDWLEAVGPS